MIFLDACAIIYLIEGDHFVRSRVLAHLRKPANRSTHTARYAASRFSVLECLVKPLREKNADLLTRYQAFFAAQDLLLVELTAAVVEQALLLRAEHRLRTPDALQAASALSLPCRRFLTNDASFRKIDTLPVTFIR